MKSKEQILAMELAECPDTLSLEQFRRACHISKRKAFELVNTSAVRGEKTGRFTCCYKISKTEALRYLSSLEETPQVITNGNSQHIVGKQFEVPAKLLSKLVIYYAKMLSSYPDALSTKQVGDCLGYGTHTVRKWIREDYLQAVRVGGCYYILKESLCEFLISERFRHLSAKSLQHIELEEQAQKTL